ncbi:sulfatase-like hydrolase/transferase [Novipirellula sp. SH528]|uniref:sulfatase-like hydrolase/transferase n=1 Tax=Novipirellula sp. SH528 TaxID=3454466 RepID=UPI003FA14833
MKNVAPMVRSRSMQVGISVFAIAVALSSTSVDAGDPPRPNIVVILCDDLGYADVGFNGAKDIQTPALDRLAHDGTIFTSAYVTHPFCGPSRMGLMAGRYPHEFGAPFNLPNAGLGIEEYNRQGISVDETLISTVLQGAGYYTGVMGKWHLGIDSQFHPNNRGFDDFYGFLGGGHDYFPEKYTATYERQKKAGKTVFNDYVLPLEHNGKEVNETEYMTDALSREGVRFVNDAAKKDQPFFLYLSYNAPHTPLQAKEEDLAKYAGIDDEKRRTYAAMVHAVDRGVGEVVKALEQTDELNNTLIVFLSDNGGKEGAGSDNTPLNKGKGSVYEGGFRVPMFFHWPSVVPAGKRFEHPVSTLDFYPTFARLAGATVPTDKELDGKDIWQDFLADRSSRTGQPIFAMRHYAEFSNVGIRQDQWKACCIGKHWTLFNINEDISETKDLSRSYPEVLQNMISAAEKWSHGHTQPLWFYTAKEGEKWTENEMPNPEAIFGKD